LDFLSKLCFASFTILEIDVFKLQLTLKGSFTFFLSLQNFSFRSVSFVILSTKEEYKEFVNFFPSLRFCHLASKEQRASHLHFSSRIPAQITSGEAWLLSFSSSMSSKREF